MQKRIGLLITIVLIFLTAVFGTLRSFNSMNHSSESDIKIDNITDISTSDYDIIARESILSPALYNKREKDVSLQRSNTGTLSYPVKLPSYTFVGLISNYNGTIIDRQNVLAKLWSRFGEESELSKNPDIYNKKIFVLYYNLKTLNGEQPMIFIGYSIKNYLRKKVNIKNSDTIVLDIPTGSYWGYDVKGTSTIQILKAWDFLYKAHPNEKKNRSLEVYNLDAANYVVENVTIYIQQGS